ncbi:MAG: hypothetical protein ACREDI_11685 [Roseiarcus sp.]
MLIRGARGERAADADNHGTIAEIAEILLAPVEAKGARSGMIRFSL